MLTLFFLKNVKMERNQVLLSLKYSAQKYFFDQKRTDALSNLFKRLSFCLKL